MLRSVLLLLAFVTTSLSLSAQEPAGSGMHRPSSFDNSYAGTIPGDAAARSVGEERYGFTAIFEVRVAPGFVKTLEVRQYFANEENAVQGFMRVKASLSGKAHLVHVQWITPTQGGVLIGN